MNSVSESGAARDAALKIVRVLRDGGHQALFAGGCVRDQIMGREPSDYDVATDAPPQRVLELFRVARHVGEAFGVVMVRISGAWVEVATFRKDVGHTDGRHPDQVVFTDAEHDAQRRDFTCNGLFYDPVTERVIDYVGGVQDIERRVIRAIGEPERRFEEDYLRMLRAVRFAAKLQFQIEPATLEAIRTHAHQLQHISRERIGMEVQMMLEHPTRARAAHLLHEVGLDGPALMDDPTDREPIALSHLELRAPYPGALAAWLIDRQIEPHRPGRIVELVDAVDRIRAAPVIRRWRKALTLSNQHRDTLEWLTATLPQALLWFELSVAQQKRMMAHEAWPQLLDLLRATVKLLREESFDLQNLEAQAARHEAQGVAPPPLVTGDDLVAEGFAPGPMFKRVLDRVYDAQLIGAVETREQAIELAKELAAAR